MTQATQVQIDKADKLAVQMTLKFHRQLRAKARRAANAVKDKTLREIAYHSILQHLFELPRKRKRKP